MSNAEYEPYPGPQPAPGSAPAPLAGWNVRAIISFVIPVVLFLLGYALNPVVDSIDAGQNAASNLSQLILIGVVATVIELVITVVGLVLGHQSLGRRYAHLRGRGFGIAGLILGYISLAVTLFTVIATVLALALIGSVAQG